MVNGSNVLVPSQIATQLSFSLKQLSPVAGIVKEVFSYLHLDLHICHPAPLTNCKFSNYLPGSKLRPKKKVRSFRKTKTHF